MAQIKLDLAGFSDADLVQERDSKVKELFDAKFDHAVKGLANPLELRAMRRGIARINTEIRRREMAAMSPEELEIRSKIRARRRRN
jgi:large subunit ribosomal protein L29